MKISKKTQLKTATIIGFICLSIPLSVYALWISVFDLGTTQAERVALFKDYFPEFLHGRWDTTYLSIVFCILYFVFQQLFSVR